MNTSMSDERFYTTSDTSGTSEPQQDYVIPTVVEEGPPPQHISPPQRPRRRWRLPLLLFVATCLSTLMAGGHLQFTPRGIYFDFADGLIYALSLMTILICHEAGHYLQARRYGVRASLPYFLPMPLSPLGTLGAVIGMDARVGDRKALFDIGITGPLAGLVPTLVCCVVGVRLAEAGLVRPGANQFGDPLLLKWLYRWNFGPLPEGHDVILNPYLWAGWVGLLVTALNLFPIGQLDGGHILYGLLRKKAHFVAAAVLLAAVVAVAIFKLWWWWLMLFLLVLIGPKHPPTANDDVPLGAVRYVLGWLTLAFIPLAFTYKPILQ